MNRTIDKGRHHRIDTDQNAAGVFDGAVGPN
jgi:hypothetical protein